MADEPSQAAQRAQGSYIAQATGGGTATIQVYPPPAPLQEQNRVRFLKRLRYYYDELWEQSLQGASLIALGLVKKPDAVQHHTSLLFLSAQQPERPLPSGTSIVQAYEDAAHELLILGEPGTGKSTLLLELARHLVDRAQQESGYPLPVIVPLSSWAEKRPPFQDWLAEQVALLYDAPHRLSRSWVQENRFLPLLDGLDEVPQSARIACIEAITAYRKEHLVPLVVCSRRTEYEEIAQDQRLALHRAVVVEPLTSQQVDAYLIQAGEPLAAVRAILSTNSVLRDLATTPLMLNILTLTYMGASGQDLPYRGSAEEQQGAVFIKYVERMVEHKGNSARYPLERTKTWLRWLAQQMQVHSQTVLHLEHLQPDWLPERQRSFYKWSVGLVGGLLSGLLFGLLFGLGGGLFLGLLFGLFLGLLGGLLFGLFFGLLFGLGGGLFSGQRARLKAEIQPVEVLIWSWKDTRGVLALGLFSGLTVGLTVKLTVGLIVGPTLGLIVGLIVGPTLGLFIPLMVLGLPKKQLAEHLRLSPNEGIRHSAKNGVLLGLFLGLLGGLLSGLFLGMLFGLGGGLFLGLLFGLFLGLLFGLGSGLQAVGQHYILRIWLWRTHAFPWNASRFLEDARSRILLRRVGGGYSFVHRLLVDHFASL